MTRDENKGQWAETADEGVVPDALGEDRLDDKEPQLGSAVTGATTGDDAPATNDGHRTSPRATTPTPSPTAARSDLAADLKDAGAAPRAVDR